MKYKYLFLIIIIGILLNTGVVLAQEVDQEVINIWTRIWNWLKGVLGNVWNKISDVLGQQAEQKRPEVEEEFQKELKEMKEDVPKTTKSLWERFKELVY